MKFLLGSSSILCSFFFNLVIVSNDGAFSSVDVCVSFCPMCVFLLVFFGSSL